MNIDPRLLQIGGQFFIFKNLPHFRLGHENILGKVGYRCEFDKIRNAPACPRSSGLNQIISFLIKVKRYSP